jgi:cation diffusion facilitator family transporter
MSVRVAREPAAERGGEHHRGSRLEWITIAVMVPTVGLIYLTLGGSQAMRTAWVEDILSLIPPIAFLLAARIETRPANKDFPYGFHRAVAISFLCAAVTLFGMGAYLLWESVVKLARQEHPTIGMVEIFGWRIWHGWLMIAVLAVTSVPAIILGRIKLQVARTLHDKALYVDAEMNKADWQTAGAAILGLVGIAFGLWWADAVAAAVISLSILRDGTMHLGQVTKDLLDMVPTQVGGADVDPLPDKIRRELEDLGWIREAEVRLREAGHVLTGEAYVVPATEAGLLANLASAGRQIEAANPRLYDFSLVPVQALRNPDARAGDPDWPSM